MNDDLSQRDLALEAESFAAQVSAQEALIRENFTFEQVIHHLAKYIILGKKLRGQMAAIQAMAAEKVAAVETGIDALADMTESALDQAESTQLVLSAKEELASSRAKVAANALHDMPGGTRSKREAIRAIWASGKYKSRGICAEQECAGLGMSFDAARKALRNTPDPA